MTEPVDAGSALRRGFIRVAGKTIVEHQLDLALGFGVDRVICLARSLAPEVVALQHAAEAEGKVFNTAMAPRDLSGLVTASDELLVISEGLLADAERGRQVLESGTGVFVQPVEIGLAAGFERLDVNHASAGLARIPGRLVEMLVQLPGDCDVPSALTRIALQAGVPMRPVPAEARTGMRWRMIASEADAYALEHDWLAEQLGNARIVTPGRWLARQGVLTFGTSLLHAGNASLILAIGMSGLMAVALAMAWLGLGAAGLLVAALAWIALRGAFLLRRIEVPQRQAEDTGMLHLTVLDWLFDGSLAIMVLWSSAVVTPGPTMGLFAPLVLVLTVRLAELLRGMPGARWISDRSLLCAVLALMAALGGVAWFIRAAAVVLLLMAIASSRERGG